MLTLRGTQCDETRPVCRKCVVHYTNITECDYGQFDVSEPENMEEMEPVPESSTSALQQDEQAEEPKIRNLPIRRVRSVSPGLLDPFKSHPACNEPDLDVLMKTCKLSLLHSTHMSTYLRSFRETHIQHLPILSDAKAQPGN